MLAKCLRLLKHRDNIKHTLGFQMQSVYRRNDTFRLDTSIFTLFGKTYSCSSVPRKSAVEILGGRCLLLALLFVFLAVASLIMSNGRGAPHCPLPARSVNAEAYVHKVRWRISSRGRQRLSKNVKTTSLNKCHRCDFLFCFTTSEIVSEENLSTDSPLTQEYRGLSTIEK